MNQFPITAESRLLRYAAKYARCRLTAITPTLLYAAGNAISFNRPRLFECDLDVAAGRKVDLDTCMPYIREKW